MKQKAAEDSFYQKLLDGFDVNVLIVGDSIGEGAGTETDGQQWFKQLQTYLRTVNKSKVSVTNVSMGGNASYALFFTRIPNSIIYFFSTNLMHIFLVLKIPLNVHKR